jgi:chromosome segregation ATPase
MKKLLILLILLMFTVPASATTIYKWVDEKGVTNFTDDYTRVPPAFRDRVKTEEYGQEEGNAAPAHRTVAATKGEIKTDIYGRDETWWRGKVRPWKEELKEASEKYEDVQKEYMEQAEGLGPFNFGKMSLTQYQMLSSRLEILSKEMETYEGKMAEANEMLSKFSKEAKETGADPAWLE